MILKFENHFKDYEHFSKVVVHESFVTQELKDELQDIQDIDWESDLGRRIFVRTSHDEFCIRTWDIYDTEDDVVVDLTIFKEQENGEYNAPL